MGGFRPASAGFAQEPTFAQVMGARAAQQMQGYVPYDKTAGYNSAAYAAEQMQGYVPGGPDAEPVVEDLGRRSGGDTGVASIQLREQAMQQIQQLETRLVEINNRIAEIDKTLPGGASNDKAWEIAAQRASIGDMSAYDSMMQRGATGAQSANAIDNALMDAEKLTWGLSADSEEDRKAARNQIEVALRKAERDAAQTGTKLPDSYYRLQAALEKSDDVGPNGMTAMEYANDLASKIESDDASDEDIKAGLVWAAQHPNSKYAKTIFDAAVAGKGKTKEAKGRANAKKKEADDYAAAWNKNRTVSEKKNDWNKLVKAKHPITLYYVLNEFGNPVPKGGAK